jgi:hypothetical protein
MPVQGQARLSLPPHSFVKPRRGSGARASPALRCRIADPRVHGFDEPGNQSSDAEVGQGVHQPANEAGNHWSPCFDPDDGFFQPVSGRG